MPKKSRPSPAAHASDHPEQQMTGSDGAMYQSQADKNGVYRWKKVAGSPAAAATAPAAMSPKALEKGQPDFPGARASFQKLLLQKVLGDDEKVLLKALRPCVIGSFKPITGTLKVGISRIGGNPDVPADFRWPTYKGRKNSSAKAIRDYPMTFLAQLNCADLAPFQMKDWPASGLLSFFLGLQGWSNKTESAVIYTPEGVPTAPAAPNADLNKENILPGLVIQQLRARLSLPGVNDAASQPVLEAMRNNKKSALWKKLDAMRLNFGEDGSLDEDRLRATYQDISGFAQGDILLGGFPYHFESGSTGANEQMLIEFFGMDEVWAGSAFGGEVKAHFLIDEFALQKREFNKAYGVQEYG